MFRHYFQAKIKSSDTAERSNCKHCEFSNVQHSLNCYFIPFPRSMMPSRDAGKVFSSRVVHTSCLVIRMPFPHIYDLYEVIQRHH